MKKFRRIEEFVFEDKKVLMRVDFNVPLNEDGSIMNDKRIESAIPTIKHVLDNGARQVILISHLGRPKGQIVEKLKMDNVAKRLSELIGMPVEKLDDCVDVRADDSKKIVLMENLRFYPEEKKNDEGFARKLAALAHVYVNDAFGVCHRSDASVVAITKFLPGCAGLLVAKEIDMIKGSLDNPKRPLIAILGGLKVSDKIGVIDHLLPKVDKLLIGGAMMFTFLKAKGYQIGRSVVEEDKILFAKKMMENPKIVIPVDVVIGKEMKDDTEKREVDTDKIDPEFMGLDIGTKTIDLFKKEISSAGTIIWNGPMGWFESPEFEKGTREIADAIAKSSAITIVGGGESATAIEKYGLETKITHVSTGGGASLELIEGKELPGIAALEKNIMLFPQE